MIFVIAMMVIALPAFAQAPNAGDGISDGSGWDMTDIGAPGAGDGIPDGPGWESYPGVGHGKDMEVPMIADAFMLDPTMDAVQTRNAYMNMYMDMQMKSAHADMYIHM